MALADFLQADMATIVTQLRGAFAWWVDELTAMVPAWARRGDGRARVIAQMQGGELLYLRDGRALTTAPANGRVTLALPRASALVREVLLPRLPRADTRRLLALDLDRLTPFSAAQAAFDFEGIAGDVLAGRQRVRLAVIARETGEAALARARAAGLAPDALAVADGDGGARFDFLPTLGLVQRRPLWAEPRTWWIAAAVFLLANIGLAIGRDAADVARLRGTVDVQSDAVQLAQRAKARVRAEEVRRAQLLARRGAQDPLPSLAVVTVALPPPAWVQRLSWDGHILRLIGFTNDAVDPLTLLRRTNAFVSVRASNGDIPPPLANYQPFDVSAERTPAPVPKPVR